MSAYQPAVELRNPGGAGVADHDNFGAKPAHRARAWHRLDDRADDTFLVVGGDHNRDRRELGGTLPGSGARGQ